MPPLNEELIFRSNCSSSQWFVVAQSFWSVRDQSNHSFQPNCGSINKNWKSYWFSTTVSNPRKPISNMDYWSRSLELCSFLCSSRNNRFTTSCKTRRHFTCRLVIYYYLLLFIILGKHWIEQFLKRNPRVTIKIGVRIDNKYLNGATPETIDCCIINI